MNWLEVVLNPRLHGSIADLCGDRTEVSGVRVVDVVADGGVIEPRVIQHVEGDPAKLQVPGSAERNALPKGQVEIPETGQPQRVLRLIPEGPRSGVSKRAFVEPDGPRTIELGPAAVRIANDVEELLAERGLDISYETVRRWVLKFGPSIARRLRDRRPRPSDRWHLDEMVVRIAGKRTYLWRAVDHERGARHAGPAPAGQPRRCG